MAAVVGAGVVLGIGAGVEAISMEPDCELGAWVGMGVWTVGEAVVMGIAATGMVGADVAAGVMGVLGDAPFGEGGAGMPPPSPQ